jgi:prepilin-type N-terminal cleavage/methylation domain-containing protein
MRKSDDRGFTLVELLVAITILAIIIVPVMHTFITTTNTNRKSTNKLAGSMAAQNLFEELKGADVETFMSGADTDAVLNADGDPVFDAEGNQICTMEKSFERTVNGMDFTLKVKLDPTSYTTVEGEAEKATDYNSVGYSQLKSLSNSSNAFLFVNSDDVSTALSDLMLQEPLSTTPGLIANDDARRSTIAARLKRDITIKITKNDTSGATIVTSTIVYTDGDYSHTTRDEEIYNNGTNLNNILSNIFVCFDPMYNNSGRGSATETITIDNSQNFDVGVFLVKQTDADTVDLTKDSNYSVDVQVLGGGSDPQLSISTNMEYTEGSTGNEMLLTYSGGTIPVGKTLTDALSVSAGDEGLQNPASATRIYDVTIEVYRKAPNYDENDLLTTLEGTKME